LGKTQGVRRILNLARGADEEGRERTFTMDNATNAPIPSFTRGNRDLAEAFERYLISRGFSPPTRRAYLDSVNRYVEMLHSMSVVEAGRREIREFQGSLLQRGLSSNSLRLHTIALRSFNKFLRLSGLTKHDPTLLLSPRKLPGRIPRFLTLEEVETLIAACETPLEKAIAEVMYSTGVRISELVSIRVDDITFSSPGVIRIVAGKGNKDRIVLFGSKADNAIRAYLGDRRTGFLFEAPARTGEFIEPLLRDGASHRRPNRHTWSARYYANGVQRLLRLGKVRDMSEAEARQKLDRVLAETPGFTPHPTRQYNKRSIRLLLERLAHRAKVPGVHPHCLRRAFATHLLEGGADLRVVQELLGHVNLTTTMLYTRFSNADLKKIHTRCHPRANGDEHAEEN
jgi:integrase/recombinase XerD